MKVYSAGTEVTWAYNPETDKLHIVLFTGQSNEAVVTVVPVSEICEFLKYRDIVRGGPPLPNAGRY